MRVYFLFLTAFVPALAAALAVAPASAQSVSATCTTSVTCAAYTNTSSGVGIHGAANTGIGIRGTSVSNAGFYGASGSGAAGAPGVEGESTNSTGNDAAGAFGLAVLSGKPSPAYGAIAYGSAYGVFGETFNAGSSSSTPGFGLFGRDGATTSPGTLDVNVGVGAVSTIATAVLAESNATPHLDIFGNAPVGFYSVAHSQSGTQNPFAYAFFGETDQFGVDIHNTNTGTEAFMVLPRYFIEGFAGGSDGSGTFSIDYSGNMRLSGTLTTSKGTYVETKGASGTNMVEYPSRLTAPQVEDVGEGQMTNGNAYVRIDARLADTIDRLIAYHVFVTPEGDCKGLYVTQKSPTGFVVRELQGGRSTLAFEYRIVAKPLGADGKRLAIAPPQPRPADDGARFDRKTLPVPVTPEAQMKRRLGPQGYADAVAAIRKRSTER